MKVTFDLQHFAEQAQGVPGENDVDAGQELTEAQDPAAESDRQREYRQVRQDYKKEFDDEIGKIIKGRLKKSGRENQQLSEQVSAIQPVIKALSDRYGIDANDMQALAAAINSEDAEPAENAESVNDTTEDVFRQWAAQSEQTRQTYPDFDFDREMSENGRFRDYVCMGLDVSSAYELTHKDEILMNAMAYAVQTSERKIASSVAANTRREKENGLNAGEAAGVRVDIASLTNEQLDSYLARARQGERIDFVTRF